MMRTSWVKDSEQVVKTVRELKPGTLFCFRNPRKYDDLKIYMKTEPIHDDLGLNLNVMNLSDATMEISNGHTLAYVLEGELTVKAKMK